MSHPKVANVIEKTDFKKTLSRYRAKRNTFEIIDVPTTTYLMLDGHGDPNTSPAFAEAIEMLYPVSYALKFASKLDLGRDYVVPPLEGLWWADDMQSFTKHRDKSRWEWTLMLMVPDWMGRSHFEAAINAVSARPKRPERLQDLRFEELNEGRCVQTLHVGSFDDEGTTLANMHDTFIPENNLQLAGKHHEVYLSDFRKTAPEKQRTILRQPVAPSPTHLTSASHPNR